LARVVAARRDPVLDRAAEQAVAGVEVAAARAEQRLRKQASPARPPQDPEIEGLVHDHGVVAGGDQVAERMTRERQALHQPAEARPEILPVLLDPERELHQAHLVVPGLAAVAGDDRHLVAAARERAAGLPAVGLQAARDEARGDVVEADFHAAPRAAASRRPSPRNAPFIAQNRIAMSRTRKSLTWLRRNTPRTRVNPAMPIAFAARSPSRTKRQYSRARQPKSSSSAAMPGRPMLSPYLGPVFCPCQTFPLWGGMRSGRPWSSPGGRSRRRA